MRKQIAVAVLLARSASSAPVAQQAARAKITTPKEALGFNFGDDYQLANDRRILHEPVSPTSRRRRGLGGPS
jgi:hypothetical protein